MCIKNKLHKLFVEPLNAPHVSPHHLGREGTNLIKVVNSIQQQHSSRGSCLTWLMRFIVNTRQEKTLSPSGKKPTHGQVCYSVSVKYSPQRYRKICELSMKAWICQSSDKYHRRYVDANRKERVVKGAWVKPSLPASTNKWQMHECISHYISVDMHRIALVLDLSPRLPRLQIDKPGPALWYRQRIKLLGWRQWGHGRPTWDSLTNSCPSQTNLEILKGLVIVSERSPGSGQAIWHTVNRPFS